MHLHPLTRLAAVLILLFAVFTGAVVFLLRNGPQLVQAASEAMGGRAPIPDRPITPDQPLNRKQLEPLAKTPEEAARLQLAFAETLVAKPGVRPQDNLDVLDRAMNHRGGAAVRLPDPNLRLAALHYYLRQAVVSQDAPRSWASLHRLTAALHDAFPDDIAVRQFDALAVLAFQESTGRALKPDAARGLAADLIGPDPEIALHGACLLARILGQVRAAFQMEPVAAAELSELMDKLEKIRPDEDRALLRCLDACARTAPDSRIPRLQAIAPSAVAGAHPIIARYFLNYAKALLTTPTVTPQGVMTEGEYLALRSEAELVERHPENAVVKFIYSQTLVQTGHADAALKVFRELLASRIAVPVEENIGLWLIQQRVTAQRPFVMLDAIEQRGGLSETESQQVEQALLDASTTLLPPGDEQLRRAAIRRLLAAGRDRDAQKMLAREAVLSPQLMLAAGRSYLRTADYGTALNSFAEREPRAQNAPLHLQLSLLEAHARLLLELQRHPLAQSFIEEWQERLPGVPELTLLAARAAMVLPVGKHPQQQLDTLEGMLDSIPDSPQKEPVATELQWLQGKNVDEHLAELPWSTASIALWQRLATTDTTENYVRWLLTAAPFIPDPMRALIEEQASVIWAHPLTLDRLFGPNPRGTGMRNCLNWLMDHEMLDLADAVIRQDRQDVDEPIKLRRSIAAGTAPSPVKPTSETSFDAAISAARAAIAAGNSDQARNWLMDLVADYPEAADGWCLLGQARILTNETAAANAALTTALRRNPLHYGAFEALLRSLTPEKNPATLNDLLVNWGKSHIAAFERDRAVSWEAEKRVDDVLKLRLNLLALEPDNIVNRMDCAALLAQTGQAGRAADLLKDIPETDYRPAVAAARARLARQSGDVAGAVQWLRRGVTTASQYPQEIEPLLQAIINLHQPAVAETLLAVAGDLKPAAAMRLRRRLADWQFGRSKFLAAAIQYQAVAALSCRPAPLLVKAAEAYLDGGRPADAAEIISRLGKYPDAHNALPLLKAKLAIAENRMDDALKLLDLAKSLAPWDYRIPLTRAQLAIARNAAPVDIGQAFEAVRRIAPDQDDVTILYAEWVASAKPAATDSWSPPDVMKMVEPLLDSTRPPIVRRALTLALAEYRKLGDLPRIVATTHALVDIGAETPIADIDLIRYDVLLGIATQVSIDTAGKAAADAAGQKLAAQETAQVWGYTLLRAGRLEQADEVLSGVQSAGYNLPTALHLAKLRLQQNRPEEARALIATAATKLPAADSLTWTDAWLVIDTVCRLPDAGLLLPLFDWFTAVEENAMIFAECPGLKIAWRACRGAILMAANRADNYAKAIELVAEQPNDAPVHAQLLAAQVWTQAGRRTDARRSLGQAGIQLAQVPQTSWLWQWYQKLAASQD